MKELGLHKKFMEKLFESLRLTDALSHLTDDQLWVMANHLAEQMVVELIAAMTENQVIFYTP